MTDGKNFGQLYRCLCETGHKQVICTIVIIKLDAYHSSMPELLLLIAN